MRRRSFNITANAAAGHGTTVRIYLPRVAERRTVTPAAPVSGEPVRLPRGKETS